MEPDFLIFIASITDSTDDGSYQRKFMKLLKNPNASMSVTTPVRLYVLKFSLGIELCEHNLTIM